jgi:hypothetical protein
MTIALAAEAVSKVAMIRGIFLFMVENVKLMHKFSKNLCIQQIK